MRIRLEKISMPEYLARKRLGLSTAPKVIGYIEGTKKVRNVGFGVMGRSLPPVVSAAGEHESPSKRPPKHPAGFSERYFK